MNRIKLQVIFVIILASIAIVAGEFYDRFLCFPGGKGECLFDNYRLAIIYPVILFFYAILATSPFLFFVSDSIFKKWLRFALVWFIISFVWIASVPAYDSGMFSMMNFTKGIVARLMSVLFVPVSLGVLFFAARKERKSVD